MNWIKWAAVGGVAALAGAAAIGIIVARANECDVSVQFEKLSTAEPEAATLTDDFIANLPSEVSEAFRRAESQGYGTTRIESERFAELRTSFKTIDPRESGTFQYKMQGYQLTYESC